MIVLQAMAPPVLSARQIEEHNRQQTQARRLERLKQVREQEKRVNR